MKKNKDVYLSYPYGDPSVQGSAKCTVNDYAWMLLFKTEGVRFRDREGDFDFTPAALGMNEYKIEARIGNLLYFTDVTVILVSPGMKKDLPEREQWIPQEVAWSLREKYRVGGHEDHNGIIAVVLPDRSGSYDYAMAHAGDRDNPGLFDIISRNRHNKKAEYLGGPQAPYDDDSYILLVRWEDFDKNKKCYLDIALEKSKNISQYDIADELG